MGLQIINAGKIERANNWKILIYAKPGTGKTSLISYLQGKTLVFDLDNSSRVLAGQDNIDIVSLDRAKPEEGMFDFMSNVDDLVAKNKYKNIVIDNISSFEKDWFTERARVSKSHLNNQLQDYSAYTNYFNRVTGKLLSLKNINVLMTAWEATTSVQSPTGQSFTQYVPDIRNSVRNSLLGLTDLTGRLIISEKQENAGKRYVIMEGNDTIFAKNRLDNRTFSPANELFTFANKDTTQYAAAVEKPKKDTKQEDKGDK